MCISDLVDTLALFDHCPDTGLNSINVSGDFFDRLNHGFVIDAKSFKSIGIGDQLCSDRQSQ